MIVITRMTKIMIVMILAIMRTTKKDNDCDKTGVELRIWLKQGKEKAQTRKGKKTAGKDFRESAKTPVATKFEKKSA